MGGGASTPAVSGMDTSKPSTLGATSKSSTLEASGVDVTTVTGRLRIEQIKAQFMGDNKTSNVLTIELSDGEKIGRVRIGRKVETLVTNKNGDPEHQTNVKKNVFIPRTDVRTTEEEKWRQRREKIADILAQLE